MRAMTFLLEDALIKDLCGIFPERSKRQSRRHFFGGIHNYPKSYSLAVQTFIKAATPFFNGTGDLFLAYFSGVDAHSHPFSSANGSSEVHSGQRAKMRTKHIIIQIWSIGGTI
jgi:hypothetical protein